VQHRRRYKVDYRHLNNLLWIKNSDCNEHFGSKHNSWWFYIIHKTSVQLQWTLRIQAQQLSGSTLFIKPLFSRPNLYGRCATAYYTGNLFDSDLMSFLTRVTFFSTLPLLINRVVQREGVSEQSDLKFFCHGNKAAFGQLVLRYQPMAQRLATRVIGNEDLAQELVQDNAASLSFTGETEWPNTF